VRAAEAGLPALIFDWPGHYLGGLNEVEHFEDFKNHAHELFATAWQALDGQVKTPATHAILGGHSLGALMAIKALELATFAPFKRLAVGLGIGLNNKVETHLFDTAFYQKTLSVRRQLVSPALDSDNVFPWIREEKENLKLSGERIHLITGLDDLVVGDEGMENFASILRAQGNVVTTFAPTKMAHHEPTLGAPHLHAFLKEELKLR
jgi:predicted esterase